MASIRVVPLAGPVVDVIAHRMSPDGDPAALVFTGPGGSNGVPRGTRSAMSRHGLLSVYKHALLRVADPTASLAYTPRRVLAALRAGGPQTAEEVRGRLYGRTLRLATVLAALDSLQAGGLAAQDPQGRWVACDPPSQTTCWGSCGCGPHTTCGTPLRPGWRTPTSPPRVIDELMGHAGGRRGTHPLEGSVIGLRYRHTTQEIEARVVAAIEQRLAVALMVATRGNGWLMGDQYSID